MINEARKICYNLILQKYDIDGLMADRLTSGEYCSFWRTQDEKILQAESKNIFDKYSKLYVFELKYQDTAFQKRSAYKDVYTRRN